LKLINRQHVPDYLGSEEEGTSQETGHMHQNQSLREVLLAEIATIAPILTAQARESEKLGCLSDATWEHLRWNRLLGFLTPRELGGDEVYPLT